MQLADPGENRVFLLGLDAAVFQTVAVFLRITELQRILGDLRLHQGLVLAIVEQIDQAGLCRHLHVEAGSRNDPLVVFQILVEDHFSGFRAFDPEIFGDIIATAQHGIDPRANVIRDPVQIEIS